MCKAGGVTTPAAGLGPVLVDRLKPWPQLRGFLKLWRSYCGSLYNENHSILRFILVPLSYANPQIFPESAARGKPHGQCAVVIYCESSLYGPKSCVRIYIYIHVFLYMCKRM